MYFKNFFKSVISYLNDLKKYIKIPPYKIHQHVIYIYVYIFIYACMYILV